MSSSCQQEKCITFVHIWSCLEEFPLQGQISPHEKFSFKDPGLQTTEEPSNANEFQLQPAKGTLETMTSG